MNLPEVEQNLIGKTRNRKDSYTALNSVSMDCQFKTIYMSYITQYYITSYLESMVKV